MSIDRHLIHRCDIERGRSIQDAYNHEVTTWHTHLTGVRCRLVAKAQRVADSVSGEFPVVNSYLLLLPTGTDVTIGDRVSNVVDEANETDTSSYRIESVLKRRARAVRHISVVLEKVR